MRFTPQTFVELGLQRAPPDVRALGEAALLATDVATLDLDAQAAALVLGKPEETEPWLLALASTEPLRALELALRASRLTLRFALIDGRLARVLDRSARKPSSHLPAPAFWLALRRALDASPAVRAEAAASLNTVPLDELRVRAALAFVFPERVELWTAADHHAGLALEERTDTALVLLAVLRGVPAVAKATSWPPPPKLLEGLTDAQLEDVATLTRDEQVLAQRRRRAEVKRAEVDVAPLLAAVTEPDALETLSLLTPTPALLEQVVGTPAPADEVAAVLRESFLQGWAREVQPDGPPRDAPWSSPWVATPKKRAAPLTPPPGPPLKPGRWETSWQPDGVSLEVELAWKAFQQRTAVNPWDLADVLPMGPVVLPLVRQWARREPALLVATQEIDDGGLDEALLLAWNSRRRQLGLAAREFAKRFPVRANEAALRLCFSDVAKEREAGVVVLRALERGARAELAALNPEQRAWVDGLLGARPTLPARRPALPTFLRWAALPAVVTRDGAHALDDAALAELLAVMKATPLEDGAPLLACAAPYEPTSLAQLAGAVFRMWLAAGAPPKEKWALFPLAHFPSDAWARVLGSSCQQWAQGGFASRAQDAVSVLGRMGSRVALAEVHRLATRIRTLGLRSRARVVFDEASARLGLSPSELEDRLFPDVAVPEGAVLSLGPKLALSLEQQGAAVALPESLRRAAKALKPAVARLERLMTEGPTLGALHFTETWAMHPVLRLVAERVAWGIFRGEARVGLFVPGTPAKGDVLPLDEALGVRPVHPIELDDFERTRLRGWVTAPVFEQLERACYPAKELAGRLEALVDAEVPVVRLLALERLGWERGPVVDGGCSVDVVRRGEGWNLSLQLEPGIYAGDPMANELQVITGVHLDAPRPLSARVASELQRDLITCFTA